MQGRPAIEPSSAFRYGNGAPFQWEELESMASAFVRRLVEGSLPPDDTKAWTRILYAEAKSLGFISDAPPEP